MQGRHGLFSLLCEPLRLVAPRASLSHLGLSRRASSLAHTDHAVPFSLRAVHPMKASGSSCDSEIPASNKCLGIRLGSIFLPIWLNSCHLRRRPPRRSFVRPLSSSSRVISIARIASLIAGVAMVLSRTTSEDRNKEDAVLEPVFANRYMQQPVKRYSSRTARARARARPSRPHSALPPSLTCTPAIPAPVFLGPPFPLPLLYPLRDPLSSAASCHAFPSAAYSPPPPTRSLSMTDALAPPRLLLTPFQHLLPLSSSCLSPLPFPLSPIRLIRFPFTHTRSPSPFPSLALLPLRSLIPPHYPPPYPPFFSPATWSRRTKCRARWRIG
ncbi:unnamed protein product [Closterium sp. NIES-54]